jgi:hypothetical protein
VLRPTPCATWPRTSSACSMPSAWRAHIWWACRWGGGSPSSSPSTIPIGSHP